MCCPKIPARGVAVQYGPDPRRPHDRRGGRRRKERVPCRPDRFPSVSTTCSRRPPSPSWRRSALPLSAGGAPQVNPVWFLWDGEHILLSLIASKRKFRNLQRDARIAVAIAHPSDPYRYLEVRGRIDRLDRDAGNRVFDAISRKYTGDAYSLEPADTVRYVGRIEVERYTFQEDVAPSQGGPGAAESPAEAPGGGV